MRITFTPLEPGGQPVTPIDRVRRAHITPAQVTAERDDGSHAWVLFEGYYAVVVLDEGEA
jgi:hypothetical protein